MSHEESHPSAEGRDILGRPAERLHYIDWLRLLMVLGVIYAHTAKSGITGKGGLNESWLIDDHTIWDNSRQYRDLWKGDADKTGPTPYDGRWVSVVRPWCLPVLFWVSGSALACAYKGGRPGGEVKLLGMTLLGLGSNAVLWFLGPLNDQCYVDKPDCKDSGILFDFTIVLWAGAAFGILFQMWYTMILFIIQYLNWPMIAATTGFCSTRLLVVQWLMNMALYSALNVLGGEASAMDVLVPSAFLEAAFLGLTLLSSADAGPSIPHIPVRAYHYALGAITVVQFAALPYAERMSSIGLPYLAYIVAGFNRFYNLGFVMTRARRHPTKEGAKIDLATPLMSQAWPLVVILWIISSPSTNWDTAGLLTYPYFYDFIDRCMYTSGAVIVVFSLDRLSRGTKCIEMPDWVQRAGLFLYLFHPWLITILIVCGLRSDWGIVVLVIFFALAIFGAVELARRRLEGDDDDEDEDEEDSSDDGNP